MTAAVLDTPYLNLAVPPLHSESSRKRLVISGGSYERSYETENLRRHTTAWSQHNRSNRHGSFAEKPRDGY